MSSNQKEEHNIAPASGPIKRSAPPIWMGFLNGSLAAMSGGAASHPLDLLKVRLQIQGEGTAATGPKLGVIGMGMNVVKTDGFLALYRGLSATLLRQFFYSGTRFGVYEVVKTRLSGDSKSTPMWVKATAGITGGACGAMVGQPAEISLVRMQADGKLPVEQRRNYTSVVDALKRTVNEEGFGTLYRGVGPTITRACIVTTFQLGTYDQSKEFLMATCGFKDGLPLHFSSSFLAGFFASVASNPIDVIKTRIMNQPTPAPGEPLQYPNQISAFRQTIGNEGFLALYKGFVPTFTRQAPYVIVTFVTLEQLKKLQ